MENEKLKQELIELEKSVDEFYIKIKEKIQNLKDIAWDKQSKRESSSMAKVLQGNKPYTKIKTKNGKVMIDKNFMEKEKNKHLDNPNYRGAITTEELLSFPKVAKNVEPKKNLRQQGRDWKVLANDGNEIIYGERTYKNENGKKISRLLTAHSKTERDERGQLHQEFNDRNFHNSVSDNIIPNSDKNSNEIEEVNLLKESFDEKIKELKNNFNDIWNNEKNKTNKNSNTRKQK